MDGPGFESYMNQRVLNQIYQQITNPDREGGAFDGSQALTVENYPEIDDYSIPYVESTGISTDWQDEPYSLASTNSVNLSYMGGYLKKNLSINLGLFDQDGLIVNSTNKERNKFFSVTIRKSLIIRNQTASSLVWTYRIG